MVTLGCLMEEFRCFLVAAFLKKSFSLDFFGDSALFLNHAGYLLSWGRT